MNMMNEFKVFYIIKLLITMATVCQGCSSRAAPKPRPTMPSTMAPMTTPRPNITFPILNCPPPYAAWYCLNDATCFKVEIHNEVLYNCECANGYMGPRCEYKEIDGSYLPTRQRAMLETASIASGATLALIFMLVLCFSLYIRHEKQQKLKLSESSTMAHENAGMDEVDGITKIPEMRPFGPHHYQVLPLSSAFKR
ncbi:Protein spitz [Lucilia cuprina]|uniref:Protein spitz n=1 Tax=Lucilia cuprina TaxID=7375 RepID=A0A0L0BMX1_LUCCU|nr:Protein spitz [Lucilia cuprina]KNC21288.1 Protein spitz [Lucilia cuprina]